MAETLASHGYVAVVVGHQESGLRALREHAAGTGLRNGLSKLVLDPAAYQGRAMDIAAAKQWATRRCGGGRTFLVGHSMGAASTLIEAGAQNTVGVTGNNAFDAYVALSPQGAGALFPPNAWARIQRPVLTVTGTQDSTLDGGSWKARTQPYQGMPAGCKWLAVVDGGTHRDMGGNGTGSEAEALASQVMAAFIVALERDNCRPPASMRGVDIQAK